MSRIRTLQIFSFSQKEVLPEYFGEWGQHYFPLFRHHFGSMEYLWVPSDCTYCLNCPFPCNSSQFDVLQLGWK